MNYYEILGVQENASQSEIRNAYRKLVKQYHPDKNPSSDAFEIIAQINETYDVLSDSEERTTYDNRYISYSAVSEQEDPREIAKREYSKRKREEVIRKKKSELKSYENNCSLFSGG